MKKQYNIMKTMRYILGLLALVSLLSACEDHLDPKVTTPYGDEYAYTSPGPVEGFLTNAYASISGQIDRYSGDFLDAATGDAVTNQYGSTIYALGGAKMSSSSNPIGIWDAAYTAFQWIHLFQEKSADTATVKWWISNEQNDSTERRRLMGESYFLRAFWGMELLRVYGGEADNGEILGYPIVTEFVSEDEKEDMLNVKRDTYEACVLQILADCDSAIAILPMAYSDALAPDGMVTILGKAHIGRATAAAAYVLKSRVATYAASPAYNPTNDLSKWERAAVLSQEAIDNVGLTYTALSYSAVTNPTLSTTPKDYIFRRYHNNNSLENRNLPPAFWGNGRTNPSQNLVNDFPDSDGYPITQSLTYDPQDPFANRDPRLKNTVIYNGVEVETGGRGLEVADEITEYIVLKSDTTEVDDGFGNIVLQIDTISDTVIVRKGLDSQATDYRATRTGYYLRKWISNKANMIDDINKKLNGEHMYPILRGAEVFHNLAEASFEATGTLSGKVAGCTLSAYDILLDIRMKNLKLFVDSYLDGLTTTDEMRALLHNERHLEFAFENMRYFDMRRWKMPLEETVYGMSVTQDINGNYTYEGTDPNADNSDLIVEERPFTSQYWYHPLPYGELAKNSNLENNIGW